MHHPTDRITHTTAFVTPVVDNWLEREIAQWVHPMKDRSDDPLYHELRPAPAQGRNVFVYTYFCAYVLGTHLDYLGSELIGFVSY